MTKEYSREQLWKLFETLPQELKEAIFSEDTANNINNACTNNGIEDDRISEVAKYTGQVLLGVLLPADFQKTLEKEVGFNKTVAKSIASDITSSVFFPVREFLNQLYETDVVPIEKTKPVSPVEVEEEPVAEGKPTRRKGPDTYREPLE